MPLQTDIEDIANVEQQIEQHAQNVERIQGNAILEIGRELKFAQDLFRFNRNEGGFTGWLATRLPHINQRAAYRAIQRYEGVEEFDEFVKLSGAALDEVVKAEPDIQAIIAERVEAGEVFTAAQVKELKQKAAQEAVDRLNSEADQARKDLEELKKSATDRDIRSASEVRDLQQKISDLTAKIGELEKSAKDYQKSLPTPTKAKEQAKATGVATLASDGKYYSGASEDEKRASDAFLSVFSAAASLSDRKHSPGVVAIGCPAESKAQFASYCDKAIAYLNEIKDVINGQ
ncbi:hypothetical protein Oant_0221 [Brucella anthropi ATCC 49188]|uniref:DUF3102 domain-containing protein n=2 Tax=Brucella anthropi TaxID=529 RepID=A6WVE8_BRUA4|nr:hypothetical protein Oant_0221 [Brucella anthropi ATCC 49188]